jgi:glutathione S-transferase
MSTDSAPRPYRMVGADISYFTGKARPAFRAKRLHMEEVLPTPRAYREVLLARTGMAFLPTVTTPDDDVWQDTSDILDALEAKHPEVPLYPLTPVQRVVAYLIELYADEFLIVPALHYRWSFPESETKARGDFAAVNGDPAAAARFAETMKSAPRAAFGLDDRSVPAVEAHTHALLAALEAHFAQQPFLLGARPSLADCSLMGPLYPHLYLDAVPGRMMRERAPRTCHWIQRMNNPDVPAFGNWLPGDALAPTLRPLLEGIGRDAAPWLLDTVRAVEAWADTRPRNLEEPPRVVGRHDTRLCGIASMRVTTPYSLWMLQRPLDAYRALAPAGRSAVDAAVRGTGCEALLGYSPRHRLGKRRFKLVFDAA